MSANMCEIRLGLANDEMTAVIGVASDQNGELSLFLSFDGETRDFSMPDSYIVQVHKLLHHYLNCDNCKAARVVQKACAAASNAVN